MTSVPRADAILPFDIFYVEDPSGIVSAMAGSSEAFMQQTAGVSRPKPRLVCYHCCIILEYASGALYVQCARCRNLNAVVQGSSFGGRTITMHCTVCGVDNLAPYGPRFVRCAECYSISDVSALYTQQTRR